MLEVPSLIVPALVAIPRRPNSPPATLKIPALVVALLVVALLVVALLVVALLVVALLAVPAFAVPDLAVSSLRIPPRNIVRIYHLGGVG